MKLAFGSAALLMLSAGTEAGAQTHAASSAPAPAKAVVQEVVVVAPTQGKQTRIDRTVYAVADNLQATSGTAAELLNDVPSVAVDPDGNISLRGDSNVTILVDGKPSAQFSGAARGLSLLQFPANQIQRVEILTTPPAQFKAEGSAGVINIITKKSGKAGLSGGGQLTFGDKRRYVFALDGSYNAGKLRMSGGVGLRQEGKERLTTDSRTALDPVSSQFAASQQTIDEFFRRLMPSAKATVDYDLNERQSVGVSFSHRELTGTRYFDQHDLSGAPGGAFAGDSNRHSDGHDWSVDASQGLHFDQKLWRQGETLSLSLQSSASREQERYAYRNTFALPPAAPAFDDLHLNFALLKTEFSADYDLPLANGHEIKLGYDLEADHNAFDDIADNDDPVTRLPTRPTVVNHFRYRQQVNAAYGQYQAPVGPWQVQAGLRLEAADVSMLQIVGDIPGGRHDFGAYPSLHLDRNIGDMGRLSAGVSRRITRPDPEALNPFLDQQDTHNLRAGNPNLVPQDTWSYELGYTSKWSGVNWGATAYARLDRNSVTDVTQPISADVVLTTKANLPQRRSSGIEFSGNGKLGGKFSYALSGNLFYSQIDAAALGAAGLRSTTGLNLKASLDWRPTGADTAQVSISRADKRLTPQGYVSAVNLVNLGYKRELRPDVALVLTVSDLFDGQKNQRLITTPQLHDNYVRYQVGRTALVGLVYTFGVSKKAKPNGFEYEQ
jgi:outer membrane receptor protein involved in Fe transport